jgi:pyridoxal phosphate enzyme (YggS family)
MNDVKNNIEELQSQIHDLAKECDRAQDSIRLMAVSKKQPIERIQAALDGGHRLFGENRVQEAQERWGGLRDQYDDLELHLIGPLQTNKIKDAVALFDVIETLDREKLAQKLAAEMMNQDRDLPCLIQVNTGAESQKSGILPEFVTEFFDFCRYDCGLDVRGLMCIPPLEDPPALHFAMLKKLADENNLKELSMGMSGDYQKAIPLGATIIRVGSAVFGDRIA